MERIRLGINTSFALRRWSQPRQWMELIYSQLELNSCEVSLDLIDPMLREPTKTAYIQEILELGDEYPVEVVSCRTGQNKYFEDLLLHPNLGYRLDAIQWFEKAIDIAAYMNASYIGGYFGGFAIQDQNDSREFENKFSFLHDSMAYLSSIAYTSGIFGFFFEPFSFVSDARRNFDLNSTLLSKIQQQSKISILISPNPKMHNYLDWISNLSTSVQLISIHNAIEAKNVYRLLKQHESKLKQTVHLIFNPDPEFEKPESHVLQELKNTVEDIKGILQ